MTFLRTTAALVASGCFFACGDGGAPAGPDSGNDAASAPDSSCCDATPDAATADAADAADAAAPLGKAWAFGESGTRLYFDGASWTVDAQTQATDGGAPAVSYLGAWAGASSLYAVGSQWTVEVFHAGQWQTLPSPKGVGLGADAGPTQDTGVLAGVWGSADDDVWVLEEDFLTNHPFLHWDGSQWTRSPDSFAGTGLTIFGSGASDIWVAGNKGATTGLTVGHYDGSHWTTTTAPADLAVGAPGLWGDAADNFWLAAGSDIWHFDGSTWTSKLHTTGDEFSSLYGTASDLWAASGAASTLHWDGSDWKGSPTLVTASVIALGGAGTKDMWAVGGGGAAAHYDGTTWTAFTTGVASRLTAVVGVGGSLGK